MLHSSAMLAIGISLFWSTQTSAMGGFPGQVAAPLPVSAVIIDGLALPMQSYADDPESSEAFRKLLPYILDVSVLQKECAAEPQYEAAIFDNPVRIIPKPDAPLDPNKVAAAQSATEAAMDAYEKEHPLRLLKVIWSAEELESAAFNNVPDQPQSSRARMRTASNYLKDAGLEIGPDGWRRDKSGEIVSLDLMVELPRLNSSCHLNFLKAAVANLKTNGIHANARACMLSMRPGETPSEEARKLYLDCIEKNTDIQFYNYTINTDLEFAFFMNHMMRIDYGTIVEILESVKFEPMDPADQTAGMALAFGKRAIETGRLIPVSRVLAP